MNKLIISPHELSGLISKLCRTISASGFKPDYIVGLTRGGLVPAVYFSHWFNVPLHALNVSLRDASIGPESNLWMAEDAFGHDMDAPKNLLIIDDINDTGATFNWIMEDWASGCFPHDNKWKNVFNNNVRFAVLVDNLASKCNVKMDYCGMEINKAEEDVWVDFPWEEWWAK